VDSQGGAAFRNWNIVLPWLLLNLALGRKNFIKLSSIDDRFYAQRDIKI